MTEAQRSAWGMDLAERLREVKQAKRDFIVNGKSVSIQGSHSYTMADMDDLNRMEAEIVREIRAYNSTGRSRRCEVPTYE